MEVLTLTTQNSSVIQFRTKNSENYPLSGPDTHEFMENVVGMFDAMLEGQIDLFFKYHPKMMHWMDDLKSWREGLQ